jgi:hypothetical protein
MTVKPRQQFLLAEVQAGTLSYNGACLGAKGRYIIDREPIRYPRVQRQPSSAEMDALLQAGLVKRKRMNVTITPAGRKALRKVGG